MRHDEADDDLECEPDVADAFDVKERRMRVPPLLLHRPAGGASRRRLVAGGRREAAGVVVVDVEGDVAQDGDSQAVVRLEAERQDRRDDEEDRDTRNHLQQQSCVRPVITPVVEGFVRFDLMAITADADKTTLSCLVCRRRRCELNWRQVKTVSD